MPGRKVKSVEKTFELLVQLSELGTATPTTLANQMEMPVSTVHDYLSTLEEIQYAVEDEGKYSVSARVLYFGWKVRENSQLFEVAKPVAKELSRDLNEQVTVGVIEGNEIIYIYTHSDNDRLSIYIQPGVLLPLHTGASGIVALAHLSDEAQREYIRETNTDVSGKTPTEEELDTIREQGYATGRYQRGTESIAAPIQYKDEIVGTISVVASSNHMKEESVRERITERLLDAANLIRINMVEDIQT
ncbi:IclR family transcriptional regulator [Halobium palmae]|uniref:IclR family transcriptional regulator n=1 Tax=Halobium palmae TaxID=1776492 RepID=A0ABD5RWU4_9EURY